MSVADDTSARIKAIFDRHDSAEKADYRALCHDLAIRIDSMMLRVAKTPVPEGEEARNLFGELATDLRRIAKGEK
jgi:hypothetical protein